MANEVVVAICVIGIMMLALALCVPWSMMIRLYLCNDYGEAVLSIGLGRWRVIHRRYCGNWLRATLRRLLKNKKYSNPEHSTSNNRKMDWRSVLCVIGKVTRCKRLIWQCRLGLDDASMTAQAVGIVRAVQGLALSSVAMSRSVELSCMPDYDEAVISSRLECIITFRLGRLIKEIAVILLREKWRERYGRAINRRLSKNVT